MNYVKYGVPIVTLLLSLTLFLYPSFKTESKELKGIANEELSKGYDSTPTYSNGGYTGIDLEVPGTDVNREIEISAQEILSADTEGLIGTNNPFNIRFITQDDVEESINRILVDNNYKANLFGSEYLPYVVTLRHAEMTDLVSERDSEVIAVAKEYQEKLSDEAMQIIGNSIGK